MAGTGSDPRLIGVPDSGYPPTIDEDAIIRQVDNELMQAMDLSVPLLTMLGGLSGFVFNAPKQYWVEDDLWRRRLASHGGLAAADTLILTVTGQAHRYPVGTIFNMEDELIRVTSYIDADTVGVSRAWGGTSAAIHASTVKARVAGGAMSENDNWVYRPTSIVALPFNYSQMSHKAVRNSWQRAETRMYGVDGASDLDKQTADTLAQETVAIEAALVMGQRDVGSSGNPSSAGGFPFYITAANGADVTDKNSAVLQESDIHNMINRIIEVVGIENVGRTIICDQWAKRKISSWYAGSRRLTSDEKIGGATVDTLRTEWGDFRVLMHYSLPDGNLYLINEGNIKVGHYGATGLLGVYDVLQNQGPFKGNAVYTSYSFRVKNVPTMGRVHDYSLTS